MDITLILLFFIVLLCSYWALSRPRGLPPGPLTLPLIGSYFFNKQIRKKDNFAAFLDASKVYGDVFSFRVGPQLIVVLNGFDAIYEAFVKQSDVFSDRPEFLPFIRRAISPPPTAGILFRGYSHKWKTLRRFTLQTLRDFGVGKTSIEEKIAVEIKAASNGFDKLEGNPLEMAPVLHNMVGNVIYSIVFGTRFEFDDPKFKLVRELTNLAVSGPGATGITLFIPRWVSWLFARKAYKEADFRRQNFENIKTFIFEQIKNHEDTFDENNIRDFVDLYIQVTRDTKEERSDVFTDDSMFRVILELFIAGSETTYNTLDWAFLLMTEHPDIQERCFKEIDDVVGDKYIDYADRVKLPFIEATILEIQRLANVVPLAIQHSTNNDTTLLGHHIPKNTVVLPNVYSALMDPKHWDQPNKFNPERFINASGKLIKHDAQMPFGIGPRICLGEPLARMELFLVFANLIQNYRFEKEYAGIRHSLKRKPNRVTSSPETYKLRIKRRVN